MACEKCWTDAFRRHLQNPFKGQAEHYRELVEERKDNPCSPADQLGERTTETNDEGLVTPTGQ